MIGNLDDRESKIVVAGLTACMHHGPAKTKKRVGFYVDRRDGRDMHYRLRRDSLTPQLQKYYDSAVEAYLLAKVFHVLEEKYSK